MVLRRNPQPTSPSLTEASGARGLAPLRQVLQWERRAAALWAVMVALAGAEGAGSHLPPPATHPVDFAKEVRPLFEQRCFACHGPDKQKGSYRLDRKADALQGGDNHSPAIIPGRSADSPLVRLVGGLEPDLVMPARGERLTSEEIGLLRAWIDQGAAWPEEAEAAAPVKHWAFQPVRRETPPRVRNRRWVQTPIDAFVLAKLEDQGLGPSPKAERRTLIRRLYFDLVGLPPMPEEVERFIQDRRRDAYARLVEELLHSAHYGERWARHWLDVIRYAETHGFEMNQPRPNAWRYRDYVIRAFNEDKPYDQFIREQLAGDACGVDEATGFLVAGPWDQVKSPDVVLTSNQRADELHDMINTTGTAFLGLTLGCARCHEHKFDPIPQKDYYALKAILAGVQHGERKLRDPAAPTREQEAARRRQELAGLDEQLRQFVAPAFTGRLVMLDEEMASPSTNTGPRGIEVRPHTARGEYPAGTARGERDDGGDFNRAPNLTPSYLAWNQAAGRDVFAWEPRLDGRFRLFLSWGCGWATHARDACYVLDRDGNLETKGDQVEIARVNQQQFAEGAGEVPNRPLWSGFYDAGVWELALASKVVLRGGATEAYVAADVVVFQEEPPGEPCRGGAQPRLRPAVQPQQNLERFAPVAAHRLRFVVRATTDAEPCIDELEVHTAGEQAQNVALAGAGAKATASGVYPNSELHKLEHVNDGRYGNSRSWISNERGQGWIELQFPAPVIIASVVWGRDREGRFADRLATDYRIEADPGTNGWQLVASSADRIRYVAGRPPSAGFGLAASSVDAQARVRQLRAEREAIEKRLRELDAAPMVYAGEFKEPEPTRRLFRGDPMQPREVVPPGVLSQVATDVAFAGGGTEATEQQRRLALARWITEPAHPLTARVMANRIWQYHFGQGLVDTPSDLGANGARPTHPELLDWLAAEFVAHQWSVKHLHRLIVNSATYQQASSTAPTPARAPADYRTAAAARLRAPRAPSPPGTGPTLNAAARAARIDADARLLWRFPARRLEAEPLRDAILAVSGKLERRAGGPGWSPFEPNDNYVRVYTPKREFGSDDFRRMIYATVVRQRPDGVFGVFDCPDGGQIAPRRTRSTTPLQALNLLNSGFMMQAAGFFAERLRREAGTDPEAQVGRAFALAFNRAPARDESGAAVKFIRQWGLELFCRALFNANEFIYGQ